MEDLNQEHDALLNRKILFKKFLLILLFYIIADLVICLLERWEPGGPCGIGVGMFTLLFLFIPISAGLALYNIGCTTVKRKSNAAIALLHIVGLFITLKVFW